MTREEAIERLRWMKIYKVLNGEALDMAIKALSAEATKKKAELKENGDWDCPDVGCDECDHHRGVEWCSLAIPKHEEIDETYKMVNEAFFEGFEFAEKRYRLLIETIEELDEKLAEAVEGYTEWLEKIIVDNEGANEWLCEDTPDLEWCEKNCHYSSIQAECLRHLYKVSKGGDDE